MKRTILTRPLIASFAAAAALASIGPAHAQQRSWWYCSANDSGTQSYRVSGLFLALQDSIDDQHAGWRNFLNGRGEGQREWDNGSLVCISHRSLEEATRRRQESIDHYRDKVQSNIDEADFDGSRRR